ncbi:MAG: DNA adenine methylase [Nanoarchaeota archaeon]|nr:DNA adenine methylase [Nanoarchaeota archaeon]
MRKNGTPEIPTIVKWAGGKSQLLTQFDKFFPEKIDYYIEPFLGSGAVFFYIKRKFNPKKVLLSDTNEELINAFIVVRDNVDALIEVLRNHKERHNKEYYYATRVLDPSTLNDVEKAGRFIYLNKTCFNGLYRVNSKGKFNVPIGSYKNPGILKEDVLIEANKLLQDVDLKIMSFEKVIDFATKGAFIYFDPPYHPLKKSSFTSYAKNVFLETEQRKLAEVFNQLHKRGGNLMLSNSDMDFVKKLYPEFKIHTVRAKRLINSKSEGRGEINEIVVTNY